MANRKFLIEGIIGLAQKLGANPNKFMGTKQNINFLGTGDKGMKGTTFSGKINDDFLELGFTQNDLVKIIEQDAGYVTAGKLNDVQLNTMFNNLKMIDETFNPPPGPMNVIDLKTGTGGLNKEGLESLRTKEMSFTDKIGEGIKSIKTKLTGGADDVATKKKAEQDFVMSGAADFTDSIAAEGGRRAVVRQLMTREPDFFQLPPEVAESIAKSKDLAKGGANAPDPLVVFRNVGNFTDDEFARIDQIIESNPFDDVKVIADKVSEYIKLIRPEGLRPGFRSGRSVKGIAELLKLTNKKFGKDTMKVADEIERPASAKLNDEFAAFNERNFGGIEKAEVPIELITADVLKVKYPGIPDELAQMIGNDTNLQRKAEAIATIEQAISLKGAGKSSDEMIEILNREPEIKMSKGGLAKILEM